MRVEPAAFEACLSRVRAEVDDPVAGLFGPHTAMWRMARETLVFVGGGSAALLQLAHPYVGEAVARHSTALSDPLGRFERTFQAVYAMIFGDLTHAMAAARRVYAVHSGIEGEIPVRAGRFPAGHGYAARDLAATRWVHATLVHRSVLSWEQVLGPLSEAEKDGYWRDATRFALLFGMPREVLPATWTGFERYWADMLASDELAVTPAAAEIGRRLLTAPRRSLAPVYRSIRAVTASFLPPRLRAPYGLSWGPAEQVLAAATLQTARRSYRRIPPRLRWVPAYHEARRRMYGRRAPDRVGRAVERALLTALLTPD